MKQHLSTNTRSFVLTVSIGILVLLYAFAVFLPTSRAIAKMRTSLTEKQQFIVATRKEYSKFETMQEDLATTSKWVEDWKANSPQDNLGEFFSQVAKIDQTSGTKTERITPDKIDELKSLARHPVRLMLRGKFDQIFAFIDGVEQLPFTVWIERVDLQPDSKDRETITCELSLTVFTDNPGISD